MLPEKLTDGLTFDDVLLVPAYSEVLPHEVDLETRVTRGLTLKIPLLSAAMDTVTEAPMAIAMASQGGMGIIHKNMSAAQQAASVHRVKKYESRMVTDPVTIAPHQKLGEAISIMREFGVLYA